ncbi:MAG: hypothetical protein QXY52_01850 [Conexivisphaerales archaeon]
MYNLKVDVGPFTENFIEKLRDISDPKMDGYLHVIKTLNEDKASEMIEEQAEGMPSL